MTACIEQWFMYPCRGLILRISNINIVGQNSQKHWGNPLPYLVSLGTLGPLLQFKIKFCGVDQSLAAQHAFVLTGPPVRQMTCFNGRSLAVGPSSLPSLFLSLPLTPPLPLSLSAWTLFQLCVLAEALPCITKPVLSACPIVLRTSQVMINTNTQQWELHHQTQSRWSYSRKCHWPVFRSHKPRILPFFVEGLERCSRDS